MATPGGGMRSEGLVGNGPGDGAVDKFRREGGTGVKADGGTVVSAGDVAGTHQSRVADTRAGDGAGQVFAACRERC